MSLQGRVVPGSGPIPSRVMVIGERPGEEEARRGRPFVGPTGDVQRDLFARGGVDVDKLRLDNVCPDFHYGNPTPRPEEVVHWMPRLLAEIRRVKPKVIIAAGAVPTRALLGSTAYTEAVHGIPHQWTDPGSGLTATVLPTYHPAAHFHKKDLLPHTAWDYARACQLIRGKLDAAPVTDRYPKPRYYDIAEGCYDWYIGDILSSGVIALDTEGTPSEDGRDLWSVQVTTAAGSGLVLRQGHPNFARACRTLRSAIRKHRPVVVIHSALYDLEMVYPIDLDFLFGKVLGDVPLFDTQMAAYLLCLEPQSLKMLARRHVGMEMDEYADVVGTPGIEKQLAYLDRILDHSWPKPEPRIEHENDGTNRVYTPQPIDKRAKAIMLDWYTEKRDKEGNLIDIHKRWRKVDRGLRRMVERKLGPFPIGTLADIPLERAVYYSARDTDATFRVYPVIRQMLETQGLLPLMDMKMGMLRAAVQMKMTGILGRRSKFETLAEEMQEKMDHLQHQISKKYFGGRPFNPASDEQTRTLLRRRGLIAEKKTKKGKVSTSKKSIEHLRFEDDSIELLEQWREHQKIKDSFADSALENWPDGDPPDYTPPELVRIKCDLKITRVTSGRFSAAILPDQASAPLLAIPVRSDHGKLVRACYEAEDGYVIGSWDLDQAEMRIMADESGDPHMLKIFKEGKIDIHGFTASKCFRVPYEEAMAPENKMTYRYPAKRCGFGVITGIQDNGLFDQLRMAGCKGWDLKKVGELRADWFKVFTGVEQYMKDCHEECRRDPLFVIRDRWGMPRYLPNIESDNKYDRWEAQRQTHSHKIQGGAQGWLQHAIAWAWKELRPYAEVGAVRFLLQIHDSLMLEVADGLQEEVDRIVVAAMTGEGPGLKLRVPMRCKGSYAKLWSKAD